MYSFFQTKEYFMQGLSKKILLFMGLQVLLLTNVFSQVASSKLISIEPCSKPKVVACPANNSSMTNFTLAGCSPSPCSNASNLLSYGLGVLGKELRCSFTPTGSLGSPQLTYKFKDQIGSGSLSGCTKCIKDDVTKKFTCSR
jgi:hypothetical protein